MLPAVLSAGRAASLASANPYVNFLLRLGVLGVVAIGSFYLIRSVVKKTAADVKERKENKHVGESNKTGLANRYARELTSAFFPYGEPRWGHVFPDGTNEEEVFRVAREMARNRVTFHEVSKSYNAINRYNDLQTDVRRELSSDEQKKFNDILQGGSVNGIGFGRKLATRGAATIYDAQLRPVGKIKRRGVVGAMHQALITPSGETYFQVLRISGGKRKLFFVRQDAVRMVA